MKVLTIKEPESVLQTGYMNFFDCSTIIRLDSLTSTQMWKYVATVAVTVVDHEVKIYQDVEDTRATTEDARRNRLRFRVRAKAFNQELYQKSPKIRVGSYGGYLPCCGLPPRVEDVECFQRAFTTSTRR